MGWEEKKTQEAPQNWSGSYPQPVREEALGGGGCRQAAIPTHPTNLAGETEQLLKSYLMSLLTKVHLVKAMVFPVVKYGCGNWIIKKAEG